MKTNCTTMVLHYSFGWSYNCIKSFQTHLPQEKLVVFNNNPQSDNRVLITRTYKGPEWDRLCQQEIQGIKRLGVEIVDIPQPKQNGLVKPPKHGECLDFILEWCLQNEFDSMTLIEPDCLVTSSTWFRDLIAAMEEEYWGSGFKCSPQLPIHICPSIWNVERIKNLSFKSRHQFNTGQHLIHKCLSNIKIIRKRKGFHHFMRGTCTPHRWLLGL